MRLTVSLALALVAAACSAPGPGAADGGEAADGRATEDAAAPALSVATVNLRCLLDDWDARLPLLARELASLDPEVIAFQEACHADDGNDNLDALLARVSAATGRSYDVVRATTHRSWDTYDEGIALVTYLPVDDAREYSLPAGVFGRKAVIARVTSAAGAVWVAATHLSFGDQASIRRAQLAAIRAELPADGPALIMGDMNADPGEPAITDAVAAGYVDTWATANPAEPGYTFPATAPDVRIDHILLRTLAPSSARIFMDVQSDGVMPSDHLGVSAIVGPSL